MQQEFLRYYLIFDKNYDHFVEHTGFLVRRSYLAELARKYKELVTAYEEARSNFDMEKVMQIELGKFRCKT